MSPVRRFMTGSAVVGTALVASFFATGLVKDVQFARAEQKVENTREQLAQVEDLATVFRNVGKVVEPSVVNITVTKSARANARLPFDEDLLRRFFPDRDGDGEPDMPEELDQPQQGTGSGVIMEVNGSSAFIMTNNHALSPNGMDNGGGDVFNVGPSNDPSVTQYAFGKAGTLAAGKYELIFQAFQDNSNVFATNSYQLNFNL